MSEASSAGSPRLLKSCLSSSDREKSLAPRRFANRAWARGRRLVKKVGSIALAASLSTGALAQTPQPDAQFGDTVEVRLVEIEVAVSDRKGRSMDGLTLEDFELRVDGKVQAVDSFSRLSEAPRPTAESVPVSDSSPADTTTVEIGTETPVPEPLFLAIYVDRSFMESGDFDKTRELIPKFLEGTLSPGDQVLLATSGKDLEVLVPFDSDRKALVAQLESLDGSGLGGKLASDARQLMQEMRRLTQVDETRRAREEIYLPILSRIESYYGESLGGMFRTSLHLSRLIDSLAGLPGRREVLYVGGPVPSAEAKRLFEVWRDTFERSVDDNDFMNPSEAIREVRSRATASLARNKNYSLAADVFGKLADSAGGSGITLHTLGLENLRRSSNSFASRADVAIGSHGLIATSPDISADGRATLQMDEGLLTLSARTGGLHFLGRRKIDKFLDRVGADLTERYVLGFYAEPAARPYKIDVRLRNRKQNRRLNLRYRRVADVRPAGQELGQRTLSALVTRSAMSNPLAAAVSVDSIEKLDSEWKITLTVAVPVGKVALIDQGEEQTGKLWIYATAGRPGSEPAAVVRAPISLRFDSDSIDKARDRNIEYQLAISAPKHSTRLAVSLRDDFGPTESTIGLDLGGP